MSTDRNANSAIRDADRRIAITSTASTVTSGSSFSRDHPWRLTWIGLLFADVVIWVIADSQGPDLFAFNAHGTFLNVLKAAWAVSFLAFFLLIALRLVGIVRTLYARRTSQRSK